MQAEATRDGNRSELNANARSAYEEFIDLWKYADPNVPLMAEARAEYIKLQ
jgi:hypothetical protein